MTRTSGRSAATALRCECFLPRLESTGRKTATSHRPREPDHCDENIAAREQDSATIAALIDQAKWSNLQKTTLFLVYLTLVCDGVIIFSLGLAIPSIAKGWELPSSDFGIVVTLSLVGMSLGTIIAGPLADRFGRKPLFIVSALIFSFFTIVMSATNNIGALTFVRLIAALGIGGALPNGTALIAECTPKRHRSTAVTFGAACSSIGGVAIGALGLYLLPNQDWRLLLVVAGSIPLPLCFVLIKILRESPQYLFESEGRSRRFEVVMERFGIDLPSQLNLTNVEKSEPRGRLIDLLTHGRWRDTLPLWGVFLSVVGAGYLLVNWTPSILAISQFGIAHIGRATMAYALGGVLGSLAGAALVSCFGSRVLMVTATFSASIAVALGAALSAAAFGEPAVVALIALMGAAMASTTSPLYALAAHLYPTAIRGTGIAAAVSLGRGGATLSGLAGAFIIHHLGGGAGFFAFVTALLLGSVLLLGVLRNHIPARPQGVGHT